VFYCAVPATGWAGDKVGIIGLGGLGSLAVKVREE
jgi:D-arabinose 1-dehydrogenase-like Zn-dependent alcohol dehydrogenase